jgi:hypothetical protein
MKSLGYDVFVQGPLALRSQVPVATQASTNMAGGAKRKESASLGPTELRRSKRIATLGTVAQPLERNDKAGVYNPFRNVLLAACLSICVCPILP